MTKNIFRLALMATALTLWGCSSHDDEPQNDSPQYITISTDIDPMTRVYTTGNKQIFGNGDKVSIYAWTGAKDVAPSADTRVLNNAINVYDQSSGTWTPETPMLWKNPVEKHYFIGVHPVNENPVDDLSKVPFTYNNTFSYYNDVYVAVNNTGLLSSANPVSLTFKHVMAKILVELTYRDQFGGGIPDNVEGVTLTNTATDATINYLTGVVTPSQDRHDFEVRPLSSEHRLYESVIIPQDGINTITVRIGGEDFTYTHPTDIKLTSGTVTKIVLSVGRDGIKFGNMDIISWTETPAINGNTSGYNMAQYITDPAKTDMIYSLVDKEGNKGRIYEMDYTADYKLDDILAENTTDINSLTSFVARKLWDVQPSNAPKMMFDAGCSAFASTEPTSGNYLMGRNYDFCHKEADGKEAEIAAIVVKTHPAGSKKAVSVVDGYWLGMKRGFFTDGKTDLSMLMAAPYAFMDGINEDGFAIGVLHLDGKPTVQNDTGKKNVAMNVAMRMLLDKAADVNEAVALLNQYNMHMTSPAGGSFHFYMADAKGKYAIVEYVSENGDIEESPWKIDVMTDNDMYRYVTNFYVSEYMKDTPYGINKSEHGKDRYEKMLRALWNYDFKTNTYEAVNLLDAVSQAPNTKDPTSHTQWSSLYNLTNKTLTLYLLREFYGAQVYEFNL